MPSPAYITLAHVKEFAMQSARGDETRLEDYLAHAARIVDRMCGVPDGFFGIAGEVATTRNFRGAETRWLRVAPYLRDSIESVEYSQANCWTPEYDEVVDDKGLHWLIAAGCEVWLGEYVEITARWGFEEVPDDIVQITGEMAMLLFRQRDPALTKIQIDVNGTLIKPEDLTPRTRQICAQYKARRPVVLL